MKETPSHTTLFTNIRQLIEESKQRVAVAVNTTMSRLYWRIGFQINKDVLQNSRAEYGAQIVRDLALRLNSEFGKGWSEKQLRHCIQFAKAFPEESIVSTLWRQLSWSHFKLVLYIDDPLKREFYLEMCKLEKWSVRTFGERIQSMLYERTAISRKPEQTIAKELALLKKEQQLNPDLVFRDPYFLDFLGLSDMYSEKDLETSIIVELQRFIIELGSDFAFMARQKRIIIDNRDYYIDLLFYHRRLKCLVAIDLKLGDFEGGFKGQMELYLRYLQINEQLEGENAPLGLILCTGKNEEHIELMQLDQSNIKVAEYLTILPSQEILKEKLHRAIAIATSKNNTQ
jgi:predicted nuclease of restriction endonuclease-like (RecB) superfamily